jgi:hypothetical protein
MKLLALMTVSASLWAQQSSGSATTKGSCSPATTGNSNTFNFTCSGLTAAQQKLLKSIPALLNKLLDSQADNTAEILFRLDACVAGVNEVKQKQADWHLDDEQKRKIRNRLAGIKAKAAFDVLPDPNASFMAVDLADALSGWDLRPGGLGFRLNPTLVGIVIFVVDADFPPAIALQAALAEIGINVPIETDKKNQWTSGDLIVLAIGRKP